ncbi:MAG: oligosaccharide flippase family protein [Spirochaetes bacterium]|nr:oligosaccharide flippase family protein [Spirochaetota bacterium]
MAALCQLFIAFSDIFVSQGLGYAIIQRKEISDDIVNIAFWINAFFGFILMVVLMLCSNLIAGFFNEPGLRLLIVFMSSSLFISGISRIHVALLTKNMNFKSLAIRDSVSILISSIVGIVCALNGFGVWSLAIQNVLNSIISVIILWNSIVWRPSLKINFRQFDEFMKLYIYGLKVLLDSFLLFFSSRLDELVIGKLFDAASLGYYSLAKKIVQIIFELGISSAGTIILPLLSHLQSDIEKFKKIISSVFYLILPVSTFICLYIAMNSKSIIHIFDAKWASSYPILSIYSITLIFGIIPLLLHSAFFAFNRPGFPVISKVIRLSVTPVLFFVFMKIGAKGIAVSIVVREFVCAILDIYLLKRIIPDFDLLVFIKPILKSSLFVIFVVLIHYFIIGDYIYNLAEFAAYSMVFGVLSLLYLVYLLDYKKIYQWLRSRGELA